MHPHSLLRVLVFRLKKRWALASNAASNNYSEKRVRLRRLMHGPRQLCQRGSNYDNLFLVDEWRTDPNTTLSGQYNHRHASETPFKWRFAGVPMMAQHWIILALWLFRGYGPVLLRNPILCDISGCPPSGSAHATDLSLRRAHMKTCTLGCIQARL